MRSLKPPPHILHTGNELGEGCSSPSQFLDVGARAGRQPLKLVKHVETATHEAFDQTEGLHLLGRFEVVKVEGFKHFDVRLNSPDHKAQRTADGSLIETLKGGRHALVSDLAELSRKRLGVPRLRSGRGAQCFLGLPVLPGGDSDREANAYQRAHRLHPGRPVDTLSNQLNRNARHTHPRNAENMAKLPTAVEVQA